jgi:hypothetical protein
MIGRAKASIVNGCGKTLQACGGANVGIQCTTKLAGLPAWQAGA